ncbi:MAG: FAD-dependent oxidoreductase [Planctomycetota bacterium]
MSSSEAAIVVAGGGAAGIAAAVGAARSGARTILVERYGFLGGMATAGMVGTICGLYLGDEGEGTATFVDDGFPVEFAEALQSRTGLAAERFGRVFALPYAPPALQRTADEICAAEPNLEVRLHTTLTAVDSNDTHVHAVRLLSWEGVQETPVAAIVDASGDAIATLLAGAAVDTRAASDRQLPSLVFHLQNVDVGAFDRGARIAALRRIAAAVADGSLPAGSELVSFRPSARPGEVCAKLALAPILAGATGLATAERNGRAIVEALETFLQRGVASCKDSFVSHLAPQVGIRESRTILGQYTLSRGDVLGAARFEDAVARAAWPIELWEEGRTGAHLEYLPAGEHYEVPLRALRHQTLENVYAAGRCMSASHDALASARVIGTCLATGYAAGAAAVRERGTGPR